MWKENLLEDLEWEEVEFELLKEFLIKIKKKFSRGNKKLVKVVKLKKVEQEIRIMEEFVQEFKRVARESRYNKRALVEEFKKRINRVIRRKLIKY